MIINFLVKPIYAQDWGGDCVKIVEIDGNNVEVATLQGLECLFRNLVGAITTLAGIVFGVMLVVGGFKLIFAGGDKQKIQSAQKTFTYAVIGLALMIVSWFVLMLIEEFTGITVTQFIIPRPE